MEYRVLGKTGIKVSAIGIGIIQRLLLAQWQQADWERSEGGSGRD